MTERGLEGAAAKEGGLLELHRAAWDALKGDARTVYDIPGFAGSLAILVAVEQYTLTDVGLMFGVTGERVRQWCLRLGIPQGRRGLTRVWVDAENRFRPMYYDKAKTVAYQARHRQDVQERRRAMAEAIRAAYLRFGRPLTIREMGRAVFGRWMPGPEAAGRLVGTWKGEDRPAGGVLAEIRAAIGMPARPRGEWGHLRRAA